MEEKKHYQEEVNEVAQDNLGNENGGGGGNGSEAAERKGKDNLWPIVAIAIAAAIAAVCIFIL